MIKGLIALFTSGTIFNPMILFGVISGIYAILNMKPEDIRNLFQEPRFYAVVAIAAVIYTSVFAKVYKEGGIEIDWTATSVKMIWNFVRYFIAFVLAMSFVVMMSIF